MGQKRDKVGGSTQMKLKVECERDGSEWDREEVQRWE